MGKIKEIIKRNWKIALFDQDKITRAITKAAESIGEKDEEVAQKLSNRVVYFLQQRFCPQNLPNVEEIQDIVEEVLIEANLPKLAKIYIIYRHERTNARMDRELHDFTDPPENSIIQITKRTGELVAFDQDKITSAIYKAVASVGGHDHEMSEQLAHEVIWELNQKFGPGDMPHIEDIQDIVETVLVKRGHVHTAKAFILYREQQAQERKLLGQET